MATAALVLCLAWLLVGAGLRVLVQLHRTGDSGLRLGAGPRFSPDWWARILFVTSLLAVLAAPVLAVAGPGGPLAALDRPAAHALGIVLAVAGLAGTFATQLAMGASWRMGVDRDERTDLVTTGPFAVVRNPIYAAMVVTVAGLALMVPSPVALTGAALVLATFEVQVRLVEEPHLRAVHGAPYDAYTARVGRFVPGSGRGTGTSRRYSPS
jgi:protein-S-isoprenylcysteine O-methyltransferase Ste14